MSKEEGPDPETFDLGEVELWPFGGEVYIRTIEEVRPGQVVSIGKVVQSGRSPELSRAGAEEMVRRSNAHKDLASALKTLLLAFQQGKASGGSIEWSDLERAREEAQAAFEAHCIDLPDLEEMRAEDAEDVFDDLGY